MTWTWSWKPIITPALLAGILAVLALQAFRGPTPAPSPPTPSPGPPVVRPEPAPPPNPAPRPEPPPEPQPQPEPAPEAPPQPEANASPLTKAAREYMQTLPQVFTDLADAVESGQLKDKNAAVEFHKQRAKKHAAVLGAALDQVFSAGSDRKGAITDAAKIAGPLRDTARALGAGRVRSATANEPGAF